MIVLTVKNWVLAVSVLAYVVVVATIVTLLLVLDNHGHSRGPGNTCQCPNGTPATTCLNPHVPSCTKCDVGYHLDDNQICIPNICFCPGGTPATGTACTKDQATMCASCQEGYKMVDQTCELICTCENGKPSDTCDYPESCQSCDTGYHLDQDNNTCVQNTCKCVDSNNNPAGTPAKGTACTDNINNNICSECNEGYDMQSNKTCKSKCDIEHGETWTNWPTKPGNPSGCALCPHHYYVSTTRALPGNPPTLDQVAENSSHYQYMCSSYDKMFESYGASFKILTDQVSGNNVEYVTGPNDKDANGWNTMSGVTRCLPGMCYGKTNAGWEYCLYPCYSQPNS